jgi:hypothetical protein
MVEIGRTIISLDVFEKHFLCDLKVCKGACCVEGDSGAPLTKEEAALVEKNYPVFKKYMPTEHVTEVEKQGYSVIDSDGDLVTPLHKNRECVYTFSDEQGILGCAIEKAFLKGGIDFQKPVSCHLFPIRIIHYKDFDAVNYQQLDICRPGCECGAKTGLPLYKFLKEPLIRMYGEEWYKELEIAAGYLKRDT